MPNFEVFRKAHVLRHREATITVQKRGVLSLNKAAHIALGSPQAVAVLYDPAEQLIGIRAVEPGTEDAFLIRSTTPTGSGPYVITVMAFLRSYDIAVEVSRRWPAHLTDEVLCIDLTTPGTAVTSNRAHSRTFPIDPPSN